MEGVIIFADDHIFDTGRDENKLFQKFNADSNYSILPINNLTTLEKTVFSISTYRALILDWNFKRAKVEDDEDFEDVQTNDENPYEFLKAQKLYSLVYIYSQDDIEETIQNELKALYPNKIFFEKKANANDPDKEYDKITEGIKKFEDDNKHITVPFVWSQAINQSAQAIFTELEQADPNWIKEIYNTAKNDGTEPISEVIEVFQHLLAEQIIQNKPLLDAIQNYTSVQLNNDYKEETSAKLYHRIYYTKVEPKAPLMTGDIFMIDNDTAAILITPECDVKQKCETGLDFLLVSKSSFTNHLKKIFNTYKEGNVLTDNQIKKVEKLFNQEEIKIHIFPSFPFEQNQLKISALIDFQTAFTKYKQEELIDENGDYKNRTYKINSPFIHQLRQRYLAYIGRVGVPAIPQSLRMYNLKEKPNNDQQNN